MSKIIEFEDIVSKPVGVTYERVQTLGIYCFQAEKKERNAAYFLPRLSWNKNIDYLKSIYSDIENESNLQGKGIYASVWNIERHYDNISLKNADKRLEHDMHTLSAFKAWVKADSNLSEDTELQIYVLASERVFPKYKFTELQNTSATIYYNWDEKKKKTQIESKGN